VGLDLDFGKDETPLDDDEVNGLIIPSIRFRSQLNEQEQLNIEEALQWVDQARLRQDRIMTESFLKDLHRRMFGNVWKWAGEFRIANKNLGIDAYRVQTELRALVEDANFWRKHQTYQPDELAIRFKHRLVVIQCFPNGNGRHGRLMADTIVTKISKFQPFTWGAKSILNEAERRIQYIKTVKVADLNDFQPLIAFARS